MRIVARRYDTLEVVCIHVEDGHLRSIAASGPTSTSAEPPWIAPGFVDLQVNGFGGLDFMDAALTVEGVAGIGTALAGYGVTGYCPTVTTHSFDRLSQALRTIAHASQTSPAVAVQVVGIHLEGPYISLADGPRGAHPREHVRAPDWHEFQRLQEAADGRIRLLTLSPEYPNSAEFIARVRATGVVVAVGHTGATTEQIRAAVDAGATLSTHLGNGAHGRLPRHPNYIWDQLAEDRLMASLIVDGHHLPPAVVKTFVRAKTPERCLLISDLIGLGGLPPGRYDAAGMGAVEVLANGRLVLAGQPHLLAGAALPISAGITNAMDFCGLSLQTAVDMASLRPAALVGQAPVRLAVGAPADVVLFRLPGGDGRQPLGQLQVLATLKAGRLVYGDWKGLPVS